MIFLRETSCFGHILFWYELLFWIIRDSDVINIGYEKKIVEVISYDLWSPYIHIKKFHHNKSLCDEILISHKFCNKLAIKISKNLPAYRHPCWRRWFIMLKDYFCVSRFQWQVQYLWSGHNDFIQRMICIYKLRGNYARCGLVVHFRFIAANFTRKLTPMSPVISIIFTRYTQTL